MLIVAPDRDTPGISAAACASPHSTASFMFSRPSGRLVGRDLLGQTQDEAHDDRA